MAFADPQVVTVSAVAQTMARTAPGSFEGRFVTADGLYVLGIKHRLSNRPRDEIRLDVTKVAADPLLAGVNARKSLSVYLAVDAPDFGFTTVEKKAVVDGFLAYLTASSGAKVTQLLGGEN